MIPIARGGHGTRSTALQKNKMGSDKTPSLNQWRILTAPRCVCVCGGGGGGLADFISFFLNIPWNPFPEILDPPLLNVHAGVSSGLEV